MSDDIYKELATIIQTWLDDEDDQKFMDQIEDILEQNPDGIDFFRALFEEEKNEELKETWATILISFELNNDAINYLKNDLGWTDKELRDYPGYMHMLDLKSGKKH